MRKFLINASTFVLVFVTCFVFVGCGEEDPNINGGNGDNNQITTETAYYNTFKAIVAQQTKSDYSLDIYSANEDTGKGKSQTQTEIVYNLKENKFYAKETTKHEFDKKSEGDTINETWILQNGSTFGRYEKYTSPYGGPYYSAKKVDKERAQHIDDDLVTGWNKSISMPIAYGTLLPNTLEEFKTFIEKTIPSFYEVSSDNRKVTMAFTTTNDVHKFTVTLNDEETKVYSEEDTTGVVNIAVITLECTFTNTAMKSMKQTKTATIKGENIANETVEVTISNKFDASKFKEFPSEEFKGTDVTSNYYVSHNVCINNKLYNGYSGCNFGENLLVSLKKGFRNDNIDIEVYTDAQYTNQITSTDVGKSYNQTYYIKVTPKNGYALVMVYDKYVRYINGFVNNMFEVLTTKTNSVTLPDRFAKYRYDGEVFENKNFAVEANQIYYVQGMYLDEV